MEFLRCAARLGCGKKPQLVGGFVQFCPQCRCRVDDTTGVCPICHQPCSAESDLQSLGKALGKARQAIDSMLRDLEARVARVEQSRPQAGAVPGPGATAEPPPPPMAQAVHRAAGQSSPPPRPAKAPGRQGDGLEIWLGQRTLLIVGVVVILLGVGYFLKYSFDQNWIGPAGRVAVGYLIGLLFLGAGEFFRRRLKPQFGLVLLGGGIAALYSATFAAFSLYALFGQTTAFGLMALVTAFACLLSLLYENKWLAVIGLIGGFVTPILLSTGIDHQIALMSYMGLLNGGILSIAFVRQWYLLNRLGLFCTWLLFGGWHFEHYVPEKFLSTMIFLNLFFVAYAVVPFAGYLRRRMPQQVDQLGLILANAFVAFGFSYAIVSELYGQAWMGIVALAYAAVYLCLGRQLSTRGAAYHTAQIMVLVPVLSFLIVAIPLIVSHHWITIFWAAEGLALCWAAGRLQSHLLLKVSQLLLAGAVWKWLFYDWPVLFKLEVDGWHYRLGYTTALLERAAAMLVLLGAIFQSARGLAAARTAQWCTAVDAGVLYGVFGVMLFGMSSVELSAAMFQYFPAARFASISILWALFSVGLMGIGFARRVALVRKTALGLFAVTLGKVFLVDMANVGTPYRIASFMVLGSMLVGASWLYYRYLGAITDTESAQKVAG